MAVVMLLTPVRTRLLAITCGAYTPAPLSAAAAGRIIPAGSFRPAPQGAPLRDAGLDGGAFDRCVEWRHLGIASTPGPSNVSDTPQYRVSQWQLNVGYLYGRTNAPRLWRWPVGAPTEDATVAVDTPDIRAGSDAEQLSQALAWYEFWPGTVPVIYRVQRVTSTTWLDLGDGRALATTPYEVEITILAPYAP